MATFLSKFFGNSVSNATGFAIGGATSRSLDPFLQDLTNNRWHDHPSVPLEAVVLAEGVVQGQIDRDWATNEARNTGINKDRFDRLVAAFDTGPGVAQAYRLWHRGLLDQAGFKRALKREGLEEEWIDALTNAYENLLSPSDLAMMRQQGFIDVARQHSESALQGVNAERADLLFETSGLPPGVETALDMLRRSIITAQEFAQIVREGHTKTKYTDELLALRNHVVSAATYAELYLKNWISKAERDAGGALTGYDADAMDLLSLARGRPATVRQAIIGYRRGARVDGIANNEQAYAKRAVEESSIRPEWADVEYESNLSYPSGFQIRGEAQAGNLTEAETRQILHELGWADKWADHFAAAWTKDAGGAGAADKRTFVEKARTQLWTRTHTSYLAAEIDEAEARQHLPQAGVPGAEIDDVIAIWNHEREVERKQMTPAQIKKAYAKAAINVTTNQPWTRDEALAALMARGYSATEAQNYLNLP